MKNVYAGLHDKIQRIKNNSIVSFIHVEFITDNMKKRQYIYPIQMTKYKK